MHTLFSSSPNFAGILPQQAYPQKYPSPAFSHIFFAPLFLRKSKRQTKVAVKKNTSQDENIHFNFIRIKSKEATAEQKKTEKMGLEPTRISPYAPQTYASANSAILTSSIYYTLSAEKSQVKNKRIYRNKKNVFVNRGFPRTSIKNKRKIKKSKW